MPVGQLSQDPVLAFSGNKSAGTVQAFAFSVGAPVIAAHL